MLHSSSKWARRRTQENYWAVSLTSIPGKMVEDNIPEVIKQHIKEKKVFGSSQQGLTRGNHTWPICQPSVMAWQDEGRAVVVVYLGFSKASDTTLAFCGSLSSANQCNTFIPFKVQSQGTASLIMNKYLQKLF